MKKTHLLGTALLAVACSQAFAQTVTVDVTNATPNNVSTFNSIMMAIHSFQASGKTTVASPAGVGVNNANAAADVINVVASGLYDEVVRIDERVTSGEQAILNEAITIQGPGAGAAPSATNNAVVAPKDDGANDADGFQVRTDVNVTINNITFIPSPTLPANDDLVALDRLTATAAPGSTFTLQSCIMTLYGTGNVPVMQSKADALIDKSASVTTPTGSYDDFMSPFPDANESCTINIIDCVIGQSAVHAGAHDGIVMTDGNNTTGVFNLNFISSYIVYVGRHGYQFASGSSTSAALHNYVFSGTNVGAGPVNTLGGPSFICFNGPAAAGNGFLDAAAAGRRKIITINNLICANNANRQISFGANGQLTMTDSLISGPVPIVYQHDTASVAKTWSDVTMRSTSSSLFGATGNGVTLTINDSIFAGNGGAAQAIGVFGTGDMLIAVNNSATVLSGTNALASRGGTGTLGANTTFTNVINDDALFVSIDPTSPDFLDVSSSAYSSAATGNVALAGGGNYVGAAPSAVGEWTVFND